MSRRAQGFTLTELLIVITVIVIIAAVGIPRLFKTRIAADQKSAVDTLRTYSDAMNEYAKRYPSVGFAQSFIQLGPPREGSAESGPHAAAIVDNVMGAPSPAKTGYKFALHTSSPATYTITAAPVAPGQTGQMYYFMDQSGIVRYNLDGPATENDRKLGD